MSETEAASGPAVPPSLRPDALPPEDKSRWPKVIGLISLFYAVGGMLCGVVISIWMTFIGTLMGKMMDVEVTLPVPVKAMLLAVAAVNLVIGVMMLMGAIALLRRKRSGVKLLRRWAVLRMVVLLIGAVVNIAVAPSQIKMQKAMVEAGNRRIEERGREPRPVPSDEQLYRGLIINTAVFSGIVAIYPLFLGFYLSRRKITQQIEHWPSR